MIGEEDGEGGGEEILTLQATFVNIPNLEKKSGYISTKLPRLCWRETSIMRERQSEVTNPRDETIPSSRNQNTPTVIYTHGLFFLSF